MARQSSGKATIDTTAGGVKIVDASENRNGIILTNEGSVDVWIGFGENPVAGEGSKVPASGAAIYHYAGRPDGWDDITTEEIKGITASGSADVAFQEL